MLATLDWLKKLFKSLSNISLLISKLSKNSSTFPVTVSKNNFHIYVCNTCYQLFHHLFDTYLLTLSMLGYLISRNELVLDVMDQNKKAQPPSKLYPSKFDEKLKIRFAEIRRFIQKWSTKIKTRNLGCSVFFAKGP